MYLIIEMRKGKVLAPLGLKKKRHDKIVARETQFTEKTYKKFIKAKWENWLPLAVLLLLVVFPQMLSIPWMR